MTRYGFREALGAFFHADTNTLRRWLPAGLSPLEAQPGHALIAVTAFDFTESEVGAYGELVISVLVPPFATRGSPLPHAATFPVVLATTTASSRAHASERWLLPEHERCLDIEFRRDGQQRSVHVHDRGELVLTLSVKRSAGVPSDRLYQVFSARDGQLHRVNLHILGDLDEHQDETGRLQLYAHPITSRIESALLDDRPIVEQSIESGEQQFSDLVSHKWEQS